MMIPVPDPFHEPAWWVAFLDALKQVRIRGEISADSAIRTVFSTDNSIYQVTPTAVIFPHDAEDLRQIVALAATGGFPGVALSPRGGGTGTNGQSLTGGVVVDTSRHMNRILSLDVNNRLVTVQPGVVLDQLNHHLAQFGLFFPPTVSTASRATIGGMIATDASGKGSRRYGKTSDYIHAMDVVLSDGSSFAVRAVSEAELEELVGRDDLVGRLYREVLRVVTENRDLIEKTFPKMNRGLTGYNLAGVYDGSNFDLTRLLAGSEGTLALTSAVTLRVLAQPRHRAVVAVAYDTFTNCLEDTARLLTADPLAIEIVDEKVLCLASKDPIGNQIQELIGERPLAEIGGLSIIELTADTPSGLARAVADLCCLLVSGQHGILSSSATQDPAKVKEVWEFRKRAVGLLAKKGGQRQGVPFVEDTAVPPERLAEYIAEFRGLLDSYGVDYGMFGHADVGCLHVRPMLDMREPGDAALIRPISDAVAELTLKYGGLLWGEHGRGFRGEYSPFFFGPKLYEELCEIKRAFDPQNLFNPGKLASARRAGPIHRIDGVPLRGDLDRTIAADLSQTYDRAIACNGNGACQSWNASEAMCPSFKVTGDRLHSPRGRAALLREWARRSSASGTHAARETRDFEHKVAQSLSTCLSCKVCATNCPVAVDIPSMKSKFLKAYYRQSKRPMRHHLVSHLETALAVGRFMPGLANCVLQSKVSRRIMERYFGLVDMPRFSPRSGKRASYLERNAAQSSGNSLTVALVEDSFTASFDRGVLVAIEEVLKALGYSVRRIRPFANGKALHTLGMLDRFLSVAKRAQRKVSEVQSAGIPVVAADSVIALMFDFEYPQITGTRQMSPVWTLDEFLATEIAARRVHVPQFVDQTAYRIFLHCSEKSARPRAGANWTEVFKAFGLCASVGSTGCCGMAGLFGHERENQDISEALFNLTWKGQVGAESREKSLATGYSCRSQTVRFSGEAVEHPAQILLRQLRALNAAG